MEEQEIETEIEQKRLKQTREIKEQELVKPKEKTEMKVGGIVIDIKEDIELIEEREVEIKKEAEKLKKRKRNRKGRIILIINTTIRVLFNSVCYIMHY